MGKHHITKILVLILIFMTGCRKDFLDYSKRGSTTPDNFYKTDAQAEEALMAAYDSWQGQVAATGAGWQYLYMNMALSDESYAGGGQRGDNGGQLEELNEYRFNPATPAVQGFYQWLYTAVNRANLVINNVSPDTDNKILYIAMAKALRAYSYFYLVNFFGDVPLITTLLEPSEYKLARTPKADVWAQIEKDLTEAITDLPVRSQMPEEYNHLITKGTAQAMLGKAYLFEKKYDEAASMLGQVIGSGEYGLYPDYSKILRPESEYGTEAVWDIPYITNLNYDTYSFGSEANTFLFMLSPRVSYFNCPALGVLPMWGFLNPHKAMYDAYTAAGDTVRRNASIISEADIDALGGTLRNFAGDLPYANDGYVRLKYVFYNGDGSATSQEGNNGTNIRMIRYADVLLMAAEANNRKPTPDDAKARLYVNEVRARVSLPAINSSGDQLFSDIKRERKLELAFEGERYLDLVRWGDAEAALKDQGKVIPLGTGESLSLPDAGYKANKNELLPIPEYEITVNPNMTQNLGY
jgi:hypothetical protein